MAYRTQSEDTHPQVEKLIFEKMRQAGASRRLELAFSHTASVICISRDRIAREHPKWSTRQVGLHWAKITYGTELGERVEAKLRQRAITL
jgi:hypothetical protein